MRSTFTTAKASRQNRWRRRNIDAFLDAGVDAVVANAAGCGAGHERILAISLRDDPILRGEGGSDSASHRQGCRAISRRISASWVNSPPKDDCYLSRPLSSCPRPARAQPAAEFAEIDSGTATQGDGRLGSPAAAVPGFTTSPILGSPSISSKRKCNPWPQLKPKLLSHPIRAACSNYGTDRNNTDPEVRFITSWISCDRAYSARPNLRRQMRFSSDRLAQSLEGRAWR